MARKIITNKKSRKDDLDPNKDEFIERSMSFLDWAVERRKQIGALLIVALVAAIAGIAFNHYSESKAEEQSAAVEDELAAIVAPVIEIPDGEEVPPKDELLYFESVEARANETLRAFEEAQKVVAGTNVGKMALLGKAGASFDLGKYADASAAYEEFLAGMDDETRWLEPNAREGLGHAYEAEGKLDEADKAFGELTEKSEGRLALLGKYHQARIAEKKGEKNKAGELLTEVMEGITEDGQMDRLDYLFLQTRERLLNINPRADVPSLPGGGMNGFDPQLLQQLMQAQQAAGGGAS